VFAVVVVPAAAAAAVLPALAVAVVAVGVEVVHGEEQAQVDTAHLSASQAAAPGHIPDKQLAAVDIDTGTAPV
jgi:hypothetical protein